MEGLLALIAIFGFIFSIISIMIAIKVTIKVFKESKGQFLRIILSVLFFTVVGYLKDGYVTLTLIQFGLLGFTIYLGYLLIIKDRINMN